MITTVEAEPIVLVDSFTDEREMYAHALRRQRTLVEFDNGEAAYEFSKSMDPALIITDAVLVGRTGGIDLTYRLKHDERTKKVPVIIVSDQRRNGDRTRALDAGCDLYLQKPCLPDVLVAEARRLIRLRAVQTRNKSKELIERALRIRDCRLAH